MTSVRNLALATLLTASAGPAPAQNLSFDRKLYQAAPGETIHLKLFVSECNDSVAGARFALRVRSADAGEIDIARAAGFAGESFAGFDYAENNALPELAATSGELRGAVREYRGALFTQDDPPTRVLARQPKHMATVVVPLGFGATGRYVVEIASSMDKHGEPLTALYDEDGAIMNPPGRSAPYTSVAGILVHDGRSPLATNFVGGTAEGWVFLGEPGVDGSSPAVGLAEPASGLAIASEDPTAYGTWKWNSDRLGPWRRLGAETLFVSDWVLGAGTTIDASVSALREGVNQQTIANMNGVRSVRVLSGSPFAAAESDLDVSFTLLPGFDASAGRAMVSLSGVTERVVAVPAGERKLDYLRVFSRGQDGGWIPAEDAEFAFYDSSRTNTTDGIGVSLDCEDGGFCIGSWKTPPGVSGIIADPGRWYRFEAGLVVPENGANPPVGRLRVHTRDYRWMSTYTFRPDAGQTTFAGWFAPAADSEGEELFLSFDVLDTLDEAAGGESPALFLKQLRVESWPAVP